MSLLISSGTVFYFNTKKGESDEGSLLFIPGAAYPSSFLSTAF